MEPKEVKPDPSTEQVREKAKAYLPDILPLMDSISSEQVDELMLEIDADLKKAKEKRVECERALPRRK
jgi:hypothetical protein